MKVALIPAYKPNENLGKIVEQLIQFDIYPVIIDDGSGIEYQNYFSFSKGTLLHNLTNQGKGNALKKGLQYLNDTLNEPCQIVTIDSDGQHQVKDAVKALELAKSNPNSLVLGVRTFDKVVPLPNRLGNKLTSFFFTLASGRKLADTQTGLRAFDAKLIPQLLNIPGNRYEYEMNVLLYLGRNKVEFETFPIATIYNHDHNSHFRKVKDSFLIYHELFAFIGSSLFSFLVDYGCFSLFSFLFGSLSYGIPLSNILARIISATTNYLTNRNLVFHDQQNYKNTLVKYFLLALTILIGNTLLVSFLVYGLSWNKYLAKIITELIFFILSWALQGRYIFQKATR